MPTLWFSYSIGSYSLDGDMPLSSPYTITWHVGNYLRARAIEIGYDFQYRNLDDQSPVIFSPDDIVVGHTWFSGGFMDMALAANVRRKIILQPYSHKMVSDSDIPRVVAMWDKADHIFTITGEYWHQTMQDTPYAPLYRKITRLDMAINPATHQHCKTTWNKIGNRGVLTMGADIPVKGLKHVAELARIMGFRWGHVGGIEPATYAHVPQFTHHGGMTLDADNQRRVCHDYDLMVSLANADANPTTLLEAAAWGLIAFANQESGYYPAWHADNPCAATPFIGLKLGDTAYNIRQLRRWLEKDEYDLDTHGRAVSQIITSNYTFDRMCSAIWDDIKNSFSETPIELT